MWYNVHARREHLGVSLAGQTATGIQLTLNRKTSRFVQVLWYNVRRNCEHLGVSLTGLKGKAKAQNVPVGSKIMV